MSLCIFCKGQHTEETVEHIVPRSLGNLHYILPKGNVCDRCNNRFARFENQVVSSDFFIAERKRFGLLRDASEVSGEPLEEIAMRKFVAKVGFEAMYRSRRRIWKETDFSPLLDLLVYGRESELFVPPGVSDLTFKQVPRLVNRFRLGNNRIRLESARRDKELYFRFTFGKIRSTMRIA